VAISARRVTVTTSATQLTSKPTDSTTGSSVAVKAPTDAALYVGGPGVTTSTGFPVEAGERATFDLQNRDVLYGVLAASTGTVNVLETGI
jgi:hypothetical protein